MTTRIPPNMIKATLLTKAGKLQEATALIQSLLRGTAQVPDQNFDDVIEGEYKRLEGDPAPVDDPTPAKPRAKVATGLAETLRKIAAGGMPLRGPLGGTEVQVPDGASFLSLTHKSAHGTRDYRLYVPASSAGRAMPLIVMLHGCTQSPEDFAVGTGMNALAEEFGCLIAYPAQPSGANAQKCWNWFRPEDQSRGRGEPALIAGLTQDILRAHPADPARVFIAGLSAGGAAAAIVADAYPDVFAAVGVHSGLPVGAAHDVPSAFTAMRSGGPVSPRKSAVPTIVIHGTTDATVHLANGRTTADQARQTFAGLRASTLDGVAEGGRSFRRTQYTRDGICAVEYWEVIGAGHAWSGGQSAGSYTDAKGPDASRAMVLFFLQSGNSVV